jgi:hypothetical protein
LHSENRRYRTDGGQRSVNWLTTVRLYEDGRCRRTGGERGAAPVPVPVPEEYDNRND